MPNWFTPNFEIASIVLIFFILADLGGKSCWWILNCNNSERAPLQHVQRPAVKARPDKARSGGCHAGPCLGHAVISSSNPMRPSKIVCWALLGLSWLWKIIGELKARRGPARFLSGLVGLELIRSYYFIIRELKPDEVRQDSCWALSGLSWLQRLANLSPTRSGKILAGPCRAWADCRDWRT